MSSGHKRGRPPSDKKCHNCQKKRLRCDRARPFCGNCARNHIECSGYGRLFIWAECDPNPNIKQQQQQQPSPKKISVHKTENKKQYMQKNSVHSQPSNDSKIEEPDSAVNTNSAVVVSHPQNTGLNAIIYHTADTRCTPKPTKYLDPLFEGFSYQAKAYLHHFNRVTWDIVAHGSENANPFSTILPVVKQYPVLLNIVVASSAMHIANLHQPCMSSLPWNTDIGEYYNALRIANPRSHTAFYHSIAAKQRAISLMLDLVRNYENGNQELAVVAAFFFVNIELMDFVPGGWRAHLQAGSRLLKNIGFTERAARLLGLEPVIFDNVISNFVIYHILGSTLMSTERCVTVGDHIIELLPYLHKTEADSYLCCPATLFEIIPEASKLVNISDHNTTAPQVNVAKLALDLINRALSFDVKAWVAAIPSVKIFHDELSRERVAVAHRAAICLYVIRAIPSVQEISSVSVDELIQEIFENISKLTVKDTHFKGAAWPLFLAGAECIDEEKRCWVKDRLWEMWTIVPWGYILTSIDTLHLTWRFQDEARKQQSVGTQSSWLRDMWDHNFNCLIV